jgi:hypothetical protein
MGEELTERKPKERETGRETGGVGQERRVGDGVELAGTSFII